MNIIIHLRWGIIASELSIYLKALHLIDFICYKMTFEKLSKNLPISSMKQRSEKVLLFTVTSQWFYIILLIQIWPFYFSKPTLFTHPQGNKDRELVSSSGAQWQGVLSKE